MNNIVFNFDNHKVRTCQINGDPMFCASDVGIVLELTNVYRQIREFSEGVHTVQTPTPGGIQDVIYIDEPSLYALIFKSRKKRAKEFRKWVFSEVLPSIRKTGKYEISKSLKTISTKQRNFLTEMWTDHGCTKPYHYSNLTKEEILTLSALESMEVVTAYENPTK